MQDQSTKETGGRVDSTATRPSTPGGTTSGQEDADYGVRAAGEAVKQEYRDIKDDVIEEGGAMMHQAQLEAQDFAERQRGVAADKARSIAGAFRAGAEELERQDNRNFADYSKTAADGIDQLAGWLEDKPLKELWREAEDYARRQPLVTLGGALAVGFVLTRFLKSSGDSAGAKSGAFGAATYPGPSTTAANATASRSSTAAAADPTRRPPRREATQEI